MLASRTPQLDFGRWRALRGLCRTVVVDVPTASSVQPQIKLGPSRSTQSKATNGQHQPSLGQINYRFKLRVTCKSGSFSHHRTSLERYECPVGCSWTAGSTSPSAHCAWRHHWHRDTPGSAPSTCAACASTGTPYSGIPHSSTPHPGLCPNDRRSVSQ